MWSAGIVRLTLAVSCWLGWFFSNNTHSHSVKYLCQNLHPQKMLLLLYEHLGASLNRLQCHIWHPLKSQQQAFNLVSAADHSQGGCFLQKIHPKTKIRENIMKNTEPEDSKYSCFLLPPLLRGHPCNMGFINGSETTLQNYKFKMLLEKPPHDILYGLGQGWGRGFSVFFNKKQL